MRAAVVCKHVQSRACVTLEFPWWGTADAEIKVSSVENPELKGSLPLKPGVGQNIAMYASPFARNSFVPNFYIPSPFSSIYVPNFSLVFSLP